MKKIAFFIGLVIFVALVILICLFFLPFVLVTAYPWYKKDLKDKKNKLGFFSFLVVFCTQYLYNVLTKRRTMCIETMTKEKVDELDYRIVLAVYWCTEFYKINYPLDKA